MKYKSLALAAAAVVASFGASAAEPLKPYTGELPPVLEYAKQTNGLEIFKKFEAVGGLTGWVAREPQSQKDLIVYSTPQGDALIAGMVVNMKGENLSSKYAEEHIPAPDYTAVYQDFLKNTANVVVGSKKAKAEAIVLFDANCGYCKLMHKLAKPEIDAGNLRIVYVPVSILRQDSAYKGAGILAAKDPSLEVDAAARDEAMSISRDEKLVAKVEANTKVMRKYGYNGTPVVMYHGTHKDGEKTIFVSNGVPQASEFYSRLGLDFSKVEKLKQTDPGLAQFIR